ncbi:hypothetical protein GGR08_001470 [Bartonella fuyuanensis]|uniref:Uncharacterized protein n=1 Tax=Bartonella fuyuanensis TaxID=1460968 RepID=A0A840DZP9_9HYPH|nr:hypothetical protein [Bartonella fuyuanensis]
MKKSLLMFIATTDTGLTTVAYASHDTFEKIKRTEKSP